MLDRPVFVPSNSETGLMGAARIARSDGSGTLPAGQTEGIFYQPNPGRRQYHDDRFSVFQEASAVNADISYRMARLTKP